MQPCGNKSVLFSLENVDGVADVNRTRSVTVQVSTETRRVAVRPNHPEAENRHPRFSFR